MTTRISEAIHGWLGWCPHGNGRGTSRNTVPLFGETRKIPTPVGPPSQSPAGTMHGKDGVEYQENILLILLLVAGLIVAFRDLQILAVVIILTAVAVYYDAKNIHAGRNFEKESILGDVITWRPLTWGILLLVGWIIVLAIYLFSRKEIFYANREAMQ